MTGAATAVPDALAALRPRLFALRNDVLERLAEADLLDGGMLALLGNVGASLDALDNVPPDAEPADRVAIADDGREIRLMVYVQATRWRL